MNGWINKLLPPSLDPITFSEAVLPPDMGHTRGQEKGLLKANRVQGETPGFPARFAQERVARCFLQECTESLQETEREQNGSPDFGTAPGSYCLPRRPWVPFLFSIQQHYRLGLRTGLRWARVDLYCLNLILPKTFWDRYYYFLHFTDKEIDV